MERCLCNMNITGCHLAENKGVSVHRKRWKLKKFYLGSKYSEELKFNMETLQWWDFVCVSGGGGEGVVVLKAEKERKLAQHLASRIFAQFSFSEILITTNKHHFCRDNLSSAKPSKTRLLNFLFIVGVVYLIPQNVFISKLPKFT